MARVGAGDRSEAVGVEAVAVWKPIVLVPVPGCRLFVAVVTVVTVVVVRAAVRVTRLPREVPEVPLDEGVGEPDDVHHGVSRIDRVGSVIGVARFGRVRVVRRFVSAHALVVKAGVVGVPLVQIPGDVPIPVPGCRLFVPVVVPVVVARVSSEFGEGVVVVWGWRPGTLHDAGEARSRLRGGGRGGRVGAMGREGSRRG